MPEAGYMDMQKWNEAELEEDDFAEFAKEGKVYLGFDLSMTTDLTSIGLVARKGNDYRVKQLSFMPSDKYHERISKDKVRFEIFRDRGELILTEGSTVDYTLVKAYILKFCKEYDVQEVCYDKWNALQLVHELEQEGLLMVEIEQSVRMLTDATKKFRECVYNLTLKHYQDKLLKWSVGNARLFVDASENIKITKKKSIDRIDPVAALINAFKRASDGEEIVNYNEIILSDDWGF